MNVTFRTFYRPIFYRVVQQVSRCMLQTVAKQRNTDGHGLLRASQTPFIAE
jgi:hypothetical protein